MFLQINRSVRDTTIMTLQKIIYDRNDDIKQIGIGAVLQLMKVFKISSPLPVTQLSQSSGNLSQFMGSSSGVGGGPSSVNASLCSELVGVVESGLQQSHPVRLRIYLGLYEAVARNPELCLTLCNSLDKHAADMGWATLRPLENGGGPLDPDPLLEEDSKGEVVVQDSFGWFFSCAQQLVSKSEELYDGRRDDLDQEELSFHGRDRLSSLLEELSRRYHEADLMDMGFEKDGDFGRESVEGKKNLAKVALVKSLLEALMDYLMTHGADADEAKAGRLIGLFKRRGEVAELVKVGYNILFRTFFE